MLKQFRFLLVTGIVLPVILLSINGCSNPFPKRDKEPPFDAFEMPSFENAEGKPKLVKDCAVIGHYDVIPVLGYGLVVGLPGTGGEDINSPIYQMVYEDMNRRRVPNIRAILARPDTAVVEIKGYMRPGIRSGDRFDVQVTLPENSNTRSLRGGKLVKARLAERMYTGGVWATGSTRAHAEGPIMVEDVMATDTNNPEGLKKGTILSGAVTTEPRALSVIMREDSESMIMTDRIAKAINHRFPLSTGLQKGVASAQNDKMIILEIHPSYANDVPRYVRVIESIACYETSARQAKRIDRLQEELLNPATSQQAAFQLESIGKAGIGALQSALRSPDMEVRFHASTTLAYLGDGTAAKILSECALAEPAFRVYALNALSVMKNDLDAAYYLQELLHAPSEETRYGAFRALKNRNPMDPTIRGEVLGEHFSYHGVHSKAPPMVHITAQKYPEIVLFGPDVFLKQPFTLNAGPLFFVNGQMPNEVVVNKFATTGIDEKRTVSNRLDEIIRAVVDIGGTYPDVVQLLRQADRMKVLSCRLEVDCLPESNRTYRRSGMSEPDVVQEKAIEQPRTLWSRLNPRNIFAPNPGEKTSDYTGTVNTSSRD